jgi:hypothetical protein
LRSRSERNLQHHESGELFTETVDKSVNCPNSADRLPLTPVIALALMNSYAIISSAKRMACE